MTASRTSHLKYKWTMATRKEKTRRDTPSPTLSLPRIICINKFRRKRIQRAASVSQFQLCRADSFNRAAPRNPPRRPLFRLRHPPRRLPAHNDFWLVTLTYARYFEQTRPFYFDINAAEVSHWRTQLVLVQLYRLGGWNYYKKEKNRHVLYVLRNVSRDTIFTRQKW